LGDLARATTCAAAAMKMARLGAYLPLRQADVEWTAALIARWRRDVFPAFGHASRAFDAYTRQESDAQCAPSVAATHLRIVLSDIALDIADSPLAGHGNARDSFLTIAATHLLWLLRNDRLSHDVAGAGMAWLAYVRLSRACRLDENRLALVESVGRMARQI